VQLVGEIPGAVGGAIAQAAEAGPDVIGVWQWEPQVELQALLEVLEPIRPLDHH